MGENLPVKTDSGLTLASLRQKKAEQARMSSLRRLGIHKVCLRRRALTSHLLRHFWCFAVLKLRFFVPARTKSLSILTYSQGFGRRRGEKDRFKTVCFLVSTGLGRLFFTLYTEVLSGGADRKAPSGRPCLSEPLRAPALSAHRGQAPLASCAPRHRSRSGS